MKKAHSGLRLKNLNSMRWFRYLLVISLMIFCGVLSVSAAPSTPTGTNPGSTSSPGPTLSSRTVTLDWNSVSGATYYDLGVRDIASGILVVDKQTSSSSYTVTLTAGRQYRWNVAAGSSAGLSSYTTPLYFQTPDDLSIPSKPTGTDPGSTSSPGPILSSRTVTLDWSSVSGATYYDLGVRDMASGTLVVDTQTSSSSYTVTLTAGRRYRWNVAAGNSAGLSSYTTPLYFQTPSDVSIPSMPTGTSPGSTISPGPTLSSRTVTLDWSSVSGATYYEVGVKDMATGSLVVDDQTSSSSYTTTLEAGKAYRWNVAAGNSAGLSGYTERLYFQTPGGTGDPTDGFDYPIGNRQAYTESNDGDGWYNAQDFGDYYLGYGYHLGEDWNAESGGNTDLGSPVYAVADGTIVSAGIGTGWGNVIIVRHTLPDSTQVESMYAHLDTMLKTSGNVTRGEQIGTIGTGAVGGTTYSAHLHFEIRTSNCPNWGARGPGYSDTSKPTGWLDPSDFIDAHRPGSVTTYSITPSSTTVDEDEGTITFTIKRTGGTPAETVYASTTQTEGSSNKDDYETDVNNLPVNFASGQSSRTVTVTIIDDSLAESSETFGFIVQRNDSDLPSTYLAKATFTITDNDSGGNGVISRSTVINTAKSYAEYQWVCSFANLNPTYNNFQAGVTYTGVAYNWGGYDSLASFQTKMSTGGKAGDSLKFEGDGNTTWGGVDCSGFITRCWNRTDKKYGTSTLPEISSQISWSQLKPGDILNSPKPNGEGHVRLFEKFDSVNNDLIWVYEAATLLDESVNVGKGRVVHRQRSKSEMMTKGYVPRRYNLIVDDGVSDYTPPIISAFSVSPASVTLGSGFTASYTVSDSGGSGLNRVELWRANIDGSPSDFSWEQIGSSIPLSGNGPASGSLTDIPPEAGTYWYGIHVNDGADNLTTERTAGLNPIQRTVTASSYTITASAGSGGSINPPGSIPKPAGSSQLFTAFPDSNYVVNQWRVDGVAVQNGGSSYTLYNIQSEHTVQVTFTYVPPTYTITASAGSGGSISPNTAQTVNVGGSVSFTAEPNSGYKFKHWLVDGEITAVGQKELTLENITADMTVEAVFEKIKAMPWLQLLLE